MLRFAARATLADAEVCVLRWPQEIALEMPDCAGGGDLR
jgi:hypothetical protein